MKLNDLCTILPFAVLSMGYSCFSYFINIYFGVSCVLFMTFNNGFLLNFLSISFIVTNDDSMYLCNLLVLHFITSYS